MNPYNSHDEILKGVEAKYISQGNHNPYEDALNFRSQQELIELFLRIPEIPDNLNELSRFKRYQLVARLESFRVPFLSIQNLAFDIYSMISSNYEKYNNTFEWNRTLRTSQEHSSELSRQSETDTILLLGISGIGKTTAVEEIVADLNQVILHDNYEGHLFIKTQIVYLIVDCPAKATLGGLLRQILMAFDKALGNTCYFKRSSRKTIDTMLSEVVSLVSEYHVGILIIDEINHLVNNRQEESELSNFLTTLANLITTPLVLIGTYKAESLLCQNLRTTRRILKNGCLDWNRLDEESQEWQFFISELLELQYTLTFNKPTEELKHAFYEVSQGILAIAVSIFIKVQKKAIIDDLNPKEIIEAGDIQETLEKDFSFLKPMLEAIKKHNIDKLVSYEDIFDQIDQINNQAEETPEIKVLKEEAFKKEIEKIKKDRTERPERIFKKLKQLSLFSFIEDKELKNLVKHDLKDKKISVQPESEILQSILMKALKLEQKRKDDFQRNREKTRQTMSAIESPVQQLNLTNEDNHVSYQDYQRNNIIGGLDDF